MQRIEKGDPKCELGATFEVATIVGVKLFDAGKLEADDQGNVQFNYGKSYLDRINANPPALLLPNTAYKKVTRLRAS